MASTGKGAANDAAVETGPPGPDADALAVLADEAERAYHGALAKVDKQQDHLADAERAAKELQAVAVKARKAADKQSEG